MHSSTNPEIVSGSAGEEKQDSVALATFPTITISESKEFEQEFKERTDVERISIEGEHFITVDRYNRVADKEQTTKDWIRHQDVIFLNGFSLRTIVQVLRKEHLKELIHIFLYADKNPAVIDSHIAALQEMAIQLFGNVDGLQYLNAKHEFDIPDSFAVKLANHLSDIVFDLDIKDSEKKPKYYFSDSAEMQLLRAMVKKFSHYFSTWRIDEGAVVLKKILHDYLFYTLSSYETKKKYTDLFFQVAHQGGFMFSLFAAHLQHIDKSKYVILADACIGQAKIYITCDEFNVYIEECTPIFRIDAIDDVSLDVENEDKTNVMETRVKHLVSMGANDNAVLKIVSAEDYIHNPLAREVLLGDWFKLKQRLSNYANHYVQHGHNLLMINAVFEDFPDIKNLGAVQQPSLFQRMFANQDMQYQGDKILLHLGKCSPSYAENVLVNMDHYAEMGEVNFSRAVKLLQRMGRSDLAIKALLPYLAREVQANKSVRLDNSTDTDNNIKAAYHYMIEIGFLSRPANKAIRNNVHANQATAIVKSESVSSNDRNSP